MRITTNSFLYFRKVDTMNMNHGEVVNLEKGTTGISEIQVSDKVKRSKIWIKQIGKHFQSFLIYLLAGLQISENYNIGIWIFALIMTKSESLLRILKRKFGYRKKRD